MLTHEIVKYKPHVQTYGPSWTYPNRSNIKTQADLDAYLVNQLRPDDIVTFYVKGYAEIFSVNQLNCVLYVEKDINKVKASFDGKLETHLIVQLSGSKTNPWVRWVNPDTYRHITQADKEKFIDDFVQDYIKTAKATSEVYKTATAQSV